MAQSICFNKFYSAYRFQVSDTNLANTSAGKEILLSINALKEKVVLFNQQSHNLLSMGTEEEEEKVKMLGTSALSKKAGKPKDKKVQSAGAAGETDEGVAPIHVNIEANIMSLNSDYLDGRDRSDLTDECWNNPVIEYKKSFSE